MSMGHWGSFYGILPTTKARIRKGLLEEWMFEGEFVGRINMRLHHEISRGMDDTHLAWGIIPLSPLQATGGPKDLCPSRKFCLG